MRAARSADIEVMHLLLDRGADPKLANKDGLNALSLAAGNGWADKIRGTEAQALEAERAPLSTRRTSAASHRSASRPARAAPSTRDPYERTVGLLRQLGGRPGKEVAQTAKAE